MPRYCIPQTLFGRRLREARTRMGLPQDKLGVMIGIDEGSASARISRYETGMHEPPFSIAERLAGVLKIPAAYFYCDDDDLAAIVEHYGQLESTKRGRLLALAIEMDN